MASNKTDEIVDKFETMHTQGLDRLDKMNETQIRIETKQDSNHKELKTGQNETKYAIQTLNTKVKCKETA